MARVLVADDDDASRLLVVTLLKYAGHQAVEASDGAAVLAAVDEASPDLLVIDLSMPGLSGSEVIQRLRRSGARLPIALYTATQVNDAMRDFMAMYDVRTAIPKPSDPRELLAAVELSLSSRANR